MQRKVVDPGKKETFDRRRYFSPERQGFTEDDVMRQNWTAPPREQKKENAEPERYVHIAIDNDEIGVTRVAHELGCLRQHERAAGHPGRRSPAFWKAPKIREQQHHSNVLFSSGRQRTVSSSLSSCVSYIRRRFCAGTSSSLRAAGHRLACRIAPRNVPDRGGPLPDECLRLAAGIARGWRARLHRLPA
jgi:hypothetical protein